VKADPSWRSSRRGRAKWTEGREEGEGAPVFVALAVVGVNGASGRSPSAALSTLSLLFFDFSSLLLLPSVEVEALLVLTLARNELVGFEEEEADEEEDEDDEASTSRRRMQTRPGARAPARRSSSQQR